MDSFILRGRTPPTDLEDSDFAILPSLHSLDSRSRIHFDLLGPAEGGAKHATMAFNLPVKWALGVTFHKCVVHQSRSLLVLGKEQKPLVNVSYDTLRHTTPHSHLTTTPLFHNYTQQALTHQHILLYNTTPPRRRHASQEGPRVRTP